MTETGSAGRATPAADLLRIIIGYWASQAVYVAATLDLAHHISAGATTSIELAEATGSDERSLRRLLRFLTGLGVLAAAGDTRFALTETGDLLRADAPGSMRELAILYGQEFYQAWGHALHTVRTGQSAFEHLFGQPMYPHFAANPDSARLFDGAHVVDAARAEMADRGLADRVSFLAGDYRQSIPPDGDVYLLSRILHGRDDNACLDLLARWRDSMPVGSTLIVLERTMPAPPTAADFGLWFDMQMMTIAGGEERTEQEYRELLAKSGITTTGVRPLSLGMYAIIARTER